MDKIERKAGRPKGRKILPVSTGVNQELHQWLVKLASEDDRSVRYVVREILSDVFLSLDGCTDMRKLREALRQLRFPKDG